MRLPFTHIRLLPLSALLIFAGCSSFSVKVDTIEVRVPPAVNLSPSQLRSLLPENKKTSNPGTGKLEIVVIRYSPGIRKLSYSGDTITETLGKSFIRVLVKYRQRGEIQKVLILEAKGGTGEEVIKNLAIKVNRLIE